MSAPILRRWPWHITRSLGHFLLLACLALLPGPLRAEEPARADWSVHVQGTGIYQGYPAFHSPFQGPQSLSGDTQFRETLSATVYLGRRLWDGGALYFNPELDQGFGLSHTQGLAGFSNGEAQKGGAHTPKPTVVRLFLRQTFGLGGPQEEIADDLNQTAGPVDISRITITAGKFAATDIFDANAYAHDSRVDFMNWSLWEAGAWDYPADQKGFTDGLAVELNQKNWALRGGWFLEPKTPNSRDLEARFWKRFGAVVELETRHELAGAPGKLRWIVFLNRALMGNFGEAAALARATGTPADIVPARTDRWKAGFALTLEQAVSDDFGIFARASWNDGRTEEVSFTDIDRSLSLGASLAGARWGRPKDRFGLGGAINFLSAPHRAFFAVGGTGLLIGDGRLDYAPEGIVETYYSIALAEPLALTFDYQFIADPAYDAARGPVHIVAARLHFQY